MLVARRVDLLAVENGKYLGEPSLLAGEVYSPSTKRIAQLTGAQRWTACAPFPVELCPDDLVAGLRPDPPERGGWPPSTIAVLRRALANSPDTQAS